MTKVGRDTGDLREGRQSALNADGGAFEGTLSLDSSTDYFGGFFDDDAEVDPLDVAIVSLAREVLQTTDDQRRVGDDAGEGADVGPLRGQADAILFDQR